MTETSTETLRELNADELENVSDGNRNRTDTNNDAATPTNTARLVLNDRRLVIASQRVRPEVADPMTSSAKQSRREAEELDCFVASAPRNDAKRKSFTIWG